MKVLFDTSVLIASFLKNHESHTAAFGWLEAAQTRSLQMVVAAHTLAELYATLTRMPHGMNVPSTMLWQLIETDILPHASIRTLPAKGYTRLVKRLAADGFVGGIVYDAVIAEVARLVKADAILTLNTSHFRRIRPDSVNRVISPLTTSPSAADAD